MLPAWQARVQKWMASPGSEGVLLLVVALVYIGALGSGFVWDDTGLVLRNDQTSSLSNIPAVLTGDLWDGAPIDGEGSGYYRPLMVISLMVDHQFWPGSAVGHHLHSILWHLLAVYAVFCLLRQCLGLRWAWPVSAVFGLHAAQSEAVIWISARNDTMAVALGMGALCVALRPSPSRKSQGVAALLTVLAGMAKESVLLLPLCMWLLCKMMGETRPIRSYAPVVGGVVVVVLVRMILGIGSPDLGSSEGWTLVGSELHVLTGLIGQLLWLPWSLCSGYGLEWIDELPLWRTWGGLTLLTAWVVLCTRASGEQGRVARWGLAWAVLCFVPVVPALASRGLFGERYLYLSMLGFGVSLVGLLHRRVILLAPLLLGWALSIQHRLPDWRSDVDLWTATVEAHPTPYAYGGLGNALRMAGENEQALSNFIMAIDASIPNRDICPQLVGTALVMGDAWGALRLGEWSEERGCGHGPRAAVFHANVVLAAGWTGQVASGVQRLKTVQLLGSPREELCSTVIGIMKARGYVMEVAEEIEAWEDSGCLNAADAGAFAGELAAALAVAGQWQRAIDILDRSPPDPYQQGAVVRGAWALSQEDRTGYIQIRESVTDADIFDKMVDQLRQDSVP